MDPKFQNFLYANGAILVVLVAYMILWRPRRKPSRLKLSERQGKGKLDMNDLKTRLTGEMSEDSVVRKARELNVIFQFNGHDFDAYEVLGVAAGSPKERVEEAYQNLLSNSDPSSHELYRLAYRAITG